MSRAEKYRIPKFRHLSQFIIIKVMISSNVYNSLVVDLPVRFTSVCHFYCSLWRGWLDRCPGCMFVAFDTAVCHQQIVVSAMVLAYVNHRANDRMCPSHSHRNSTVIRFWPAMCIRHRYARRLACTYNTNRSVHRVRCRRSRHHRHHPHCRQMHARDGWSLSNGPCHLSTLTMIYRWFRIPWWKTLALINDRVDRWTTWWTPASVWQQRQQQMASLARPATCNSGNMTVACVVPVWHLSVRVFVCRTVCTRWPPSTVSWHFVAVSSVCMKFINLFKYYYIEYWFYGQWYFVRQKTRKIGNDRFFSISISDCYGTSIGIQQCLLISIWISLRTIFRCYFLCLFVRRSQQSVQPVCSRMNCCSVVMATNSFVPKTTFKVKHTAVTAESS